MRLSALSHVSHQAMWRCPSTASSRLFRPSIRTSQEETAPEAVARFRAALQACDAVLISSPEYAHGVPGVLKNALDWVVGSGELMDKPVALINTSARATHAWESLARTLLVMSARVLLDASITVPLGGRTPDAESIAADEAIAAPLRGAIAVLAADAREAVEWLKRERVSTRGRCRRSTNRSRSHAPLHTRGTIDPRRGVRAPPALSVL